MEPEFPFSVPFNSSISITIENAQEVNEVFELLCSDGENEITLIFDKHDRPIRLLKLENGNIICEFDGSGHKDKGESSPTISLNGI